MTDRLATMLRHHAQHNHSDEIREVASEMLDAITPAHQAQATLTRPADRAAYLAALPVGDDDV